ncbi:TetR/AcrR family transcriptional regulator [Paenibacillus cisolokensis]|uniref:TetR/AcrR family transcriptional regulator n=1 Tax=Paenibacillus cisolokensis TaxID=1658519 RepID=UPI003D27611F
MNDGQTAHRLKQAALTAFLESGYEGASLSAIAKQVGIRTPSIYAHFNSKEQLFLELLNDVIQEELANYKALVERVSNRPIKEQLRAVFDFFTDLDHISSGQAFLKRTMMVPPKHLKEQLHRLFLAHEAELVRYLADILEKGMDENVLVRQDTGRMLALFFALTDGMLVEHELYDSRLYRERQEIAWSWLWQIWTKE